MDKYGVIDLGTNTFHLLIVSVTPDGRLKELERKRIFVKLAEDGIHTIGPRPYQRGMEALQTYSKLLTQHNVSKVKAMGTAALRTASNGSSFIHDVKQSVGLDIEIIPGELEAEFIHNGVMQAVDFGAETGLIMDIGGGSVEFIIANSEEVFWAKSFPVGVAVLFNQFHRHDPITTEEIDTLNNYLESSLHPLIEELQHHQVVKLVGASGTFDVIRDFLAPLKQDHSHSAVVPVPTFYPFYKKITDSTLKERLQMEKLPESRAELIIVALILIHFILQKAPIKNIITSDYAMKEGILHQMINKDRG